MRRCTDNSPRCWHQGICRKNDRREPTKRTQSIVHERDLLSALIVTTMVITIVKVVAIVAGLASAKFRIGR